MKKIVTLLLVLFAVISGFAQGAGTALDFDGNDDYVSIAAPAGSELSGNYTFEAWVQPKHATKNMHIFSSRSPSDYGFDLQILDGNKIHADIGNGSQWLTTTADATYNYKLGVWFHVAYVVTPTGYTIYVNGTQLATANYAGGFNTPLLYDDTHQMNLGRNAGLGTYFRGAMDNVRIYNIALNAGAIMADSGTETPTFLPNCIVNYSFTAGNANKNNPGLTTLANSIGGNYTGTLQSFFLQGPIGNWTTDRFSANINVNNLYWTATLKDAFNVINTVGGLSGDIQIVVQGDTNESSFSSLLASGAGTTTYSSITIKPLGIRSITGNYNNPLIRLENTRNVTFNGLNDGTNQLTINNTNTGDIASTIWLTGGADQNTITNCNIYGSGVSGNGTSNGIIMFVNGLSDNNTISNCNIGTLTANYPSNGITAASFTYSVGTVISGNNFFNIFNPSGHSAAISLPDMRGTTTISNNRFYQTAPYTATASEHIAIDVTEGGLVNITGNTIGFANAAGNGFYEVITNGGGYSFFTGINFSISDGTPGAGGLIQNNTISGIKMTGSNASAYPFTGIHIIAASAQVSDNLIGSMDAAGAITCSGLTATSAAITAIERQGQGGGNSLISNNQIGGFTMSGGGNINFTGIYSNIYQQANTTLPKNNIIGGNIANSISLSTGAAGSMHGIKGYGFGEISGNTIKNMTTNDGILKGISLSCNVAVKVAHNEVNNLRHTGTGTEIITGIEANPTADSSITLDSNFVHTLVSDSDSAATIVSGIMDDGSGRILCYNNMVDLGETITKGIQIRGIAIDTALALGILNNSIYIGGTATTNNTNTFAMYASAGGVIYRYFGNNIMVNNRSNNGSTGQHYSAAYRLGYLLNDYNLYYGNGNGYAMIYNLDNSNTYPTMATWKAFTNIDYHSYFSDPRFIAPTATVPNLHINASIPTQAEGNATSPDPSLNLNTDIDDEARGALTPNDIGADAGNFIPFVIPSISGYSISPVCVNSQFVINGNGFFEVSAVRVGATTATIVSYTATAITVSVPTAVTGIVTVVMPFYSATGPNLIVANPVSITQQPTTPSIICAASGNRTISITASNVGSYQWRKNGTPITADAIYSNVNSNTLTISNVPYSENGAGYDVVLTAIGNCPPVTSDAVVLSVTEGITVGVSASAASMCRNSSGSVLTATGATSYTWSPSNGLSNTSGAVVTATPTTTTTYTVTGTTAAGCTGSQTVTITVYQLPGIGVAPSALTLCNGVDNTLTASGGVSYTWSPATGLDTTSGSTVVATPSVTTTYTVTGTDANGCQSTANATVTVNQVSILPLNPTFCPDTIQTLTASAVPVTAVILNENFNNPTNNWTTVNMSTGGIPENAAWTLQPDNYYYGTLWHSNDNTPFYLCNAYSAENSNIAASLQSPAFSTVGYLSAKITFYSFLYNNPPSTTSKVQASLDGTNWTEVQAIPSSNNFNLIFGQVQVNLTPAFINKPTVYIRFSNNGDDFWAIDNVTISGVETPAVTWSPVTGLYTDPDATVAYVADTPAVSVYLKSAVPQTYTAVATNSSGCANSGTTAVSIAPVPTPIDAVAANSTICEGSSTIITASNAVSYSWSPATGLSAVTGSEVTANPITTTTYTVIGTAATGCITTTTVTINVNPKPALSVNPPNPTIAVGNSVALTASGGVSYTWSPATGLDTTTGATVTANPTVTTTYTVTGTDANGCTNTTPVTVYATGLVVSPAATICYGASATLTASGAATFSWSPATGLSATTGVTVTASPIATTTYTVTGTTGAFSETKTVTVTVLSGPITVVPPSAVVCDPDTITQFSVSDGSPSGMLLINENFEGSAPGWTNDNAGTFPSYAEWTSVNLGGNKGMRATSSYGGPGNSVHTKLVSPIFSTVGYENVVLTFNHQYTIGNFDQYVQLEISTNGGASWNFLANYHVPTFLTTTETINLNGYLNQPNMRIRYRFESFYSNVEGRWTVDDVKITATRPKAVWSPQAGLYTNAAATVPYTGTTVNTVYAKPLTSTTYISDFTSPTGCILSNTVAVNVSSPPVLSLPTDTSTCPGAGTTLTVSGTGAVSYSWSPATGLDMTTGASVIASPLVTTLYTVTGTSAGGCTATKTINVAVYDTADIQITSPNTTVCPGGSATLTASGNVSSFTWSPADGLDTTSGATVIATPATTTTYTASGIDNNGCSATAISQSITVTVGPALAAPEITQTGTLDVCAGTPVTLSIPGVTGAALQFDGNDDYIDINRNIADDFTIEYWMKTTATANYGGGQWYEGSGIVDGEVGGNVDDFGSALLGGKLGFGVGGGGGSNPDITIVSNTNVNTGNWTHIALTRNKATAELKIYINGVLDQSGFSANSNSLTSPGNLRIGGIQAGGGHFNGSIDDIRIWNVVRAPSEIQATMNATLPNGTLNLVDYLKFDENTGSTATNTANAANSGILQNGSQWISHDSSAYNSFLWSNGAITSSISVLVPGNYSVEVDNGNGCSATSNVIAVTGQSMAVAVSAGAVTICTGGSTVLTATGANSYTWSPSTGLNATTGNSVTASPAVTTTYTVTGTYFGCTDTKTITVNVAPEVAVSASSISIYTGESTTLTASGASTYSWSPATGLGATTGAVVTATPTGTTTYTVTGTSATGCITTAEVTITVNINTAVPYIIASGPTTFCPGESVDLTAAVAGDDSALAIFSGAQYGAQTFPSGDYTVEFLMRTLTSGNAAPNTPWYQGALIARTVENSTYDIRMGSAILNGKLVFGIGNQNSPVTQIASVSAVNTGAWIAVAYSWSASTGAMKLYINGVEEASGVSSTQALPPLAELLGTFPNMPFSGAIDNFRIWNDVRTPSEIQQNSTVTTIPDTTGLLADFHFDEGTGNYTISGGNNYMYVTETAWTVRPTGTAQYLWSNGATSPVINVTTAGNYSVAVTKFGTTYTSQPVAVTVSLPTLNITADTTEICPGESVQITAQSSVMDSNIFWSPQNSLNVSYGDTVIATPAVTTTYTITNMTSTGCTTTKTITIIVAEPIVAIATAPVICPGGSTLLTAYGATAYTWSPSTGLSATTGSNVTAHPAVTTTYTVSGTNTAGCASSNTVTVTVAPLTATITGQSTSVCLGNAVTLTAISNYDSPAVQFNGNEWSFMYPFIPADFTIECWIKTTQAALSGSSWQDGTPLFGAADQSGSGVPLYGLSINGGRLSFGIAGNNNGPEVTITSSSVVNTGEWVHVAVTRSAASGEMKLYINGFPEATATSLNQGNLYISSAYLGKFSFNANANYQGGIDELRFWDKVRAPSEILGGMQVTYTASEPNLNTYYPVNETFGTQLTNEINASPPTYINGNPTWISRSAESQTYLWSNGAVTPSIAVTTAGNYTVQISAGGCNAQSNGFPVSVDPFAGVNAIAATPSICVNGSTAITASGAATYQWFPATGLSATTGSSVIASPSETTTYTVMGISSGGCMASTTVTITVAEQLAITPASASLCISGPAVLLTASGGGTPASLLEQDFDSGLTDWTIVSDPTSPATSNWQLLPNGMGGNAVMANADAGGEGSVTATSLVSPVFSTVGYSSATLRFEHARTDYPDDVASSLDISTDGGANWIQLEDYLDFDGYTSALVDLGAYLNQPNLKIRFHYISPWGYYWIVDTISVTALALDTVTWSPEAGLFTDAAATIPYTGGYTTEVYAKPATGTLYTATSGAGACSTTTAMVNVNNLLDGTVSSSQAICAGNMPLAVSLSDNTTPVIKWQLSTDAAFTSPTDIASTATTLSSIEIGVVNTTVYIRAVTQGSGCNAVSTYATITVGLTAWNGSAWSNGTPDGLMAATIASDYNSTGNLSACSLTITNNAIVKVNSGNDFIITNMVNVISGSLTFENNANLIQIANVANSGAITVKREATMRRLDYVYWGAPVADQDLKLFSPQTVSLPVGSSRFYTLNEITNSFVVIPEPSGVPFIPAKGFMLRAPNNFPANGAQQTFFGQFNGVPNNGDAAIGITYSGDGKGYNMLANPYPSTINADLFLAQNPGELYFWTHTNQNAASGANYATYTTFGTASASGGTAPNGTIAIGQGFLLKTSANGTATFDNTMRTGNNNAVFFRNANTEKHRIWLNLSNAVGMQNQILVGYMDGATQYADVSVDAKQIESGISNIASLIGEDKYNIQARALPFVNTDIVPLSFNALAAGTFTIAIDHLDGLFAEGQEIFLKDNLLGTVSNLQSPYVFASEPGSFTDRFEVVYQNTTLSIANPTFTANNVVVFKHDNILNINSGSIAMATVRIFDVRGRLIYERNDINATTTALNDLRAEQEVLLVQVTSDNGEVVTKKVVY